MRDGDGDEGGKDSLAMARKTSRMKVKNEVRLPQYPVASPM